MDDRLTSIGFTLSTKGWQVYMLPTLLRMVKERTLALVRPHRPNALESDDYHRGTINGLMLAATTFVQELEVAATQERAERADTAPEPTGIYEPDKEGLTEELLADKM